MIRFLLPVLGILLVSVGSESAFAKSPKTVKPVVETTTTNDPMPGPASTSSANFAYWAGIASDTAVTKSATPALSLLIGINDLMAIQTYAYLGQTSPFVFSLGADFKYTLIGTSTKGFHVGGGFGLGTINTGTTTLTPAGIVTTTSQFYFNLNALVGFQFEIVDRVMANVEAGPTLSISNNNTDFGIGAHSIAYGLSLLYRL